MKVQELLASMRRSNFNMEKELQVTKYLPMDVKQTIARGIIYECTNSDDGAIKVDSVQQYLSYVKYMIKYHTNLEYEDTDYDVLCSSVYKDAEGNECGVLGAIMDCFGEDAKECSRIMGMMMDDYLQENSMEFAVAKLLNKLSGMLAGFADKMNEKIGDIDLASMIPDGVDMDKLSGFLSDYIK